MFRRSILASALAMGLPLGLAVGQEKTTVAPGTPVTITVTPASPAAPPASFTLGPRHGHVTPNRCGFTHLGGGYIDVATPTADAITITMTGAALAGAHPCKCSSSSMQFDLVQALEISYDNPKLKKAKLIVEARVIGALRSDNRGGTASEGPGCVTITSEKGEVITVCAPSHSVCGGENLVINDHEGPTEAVLPGPGKYTLHQTFTVSASHPNGVGLSGKTAVAEFDPAAVDPLWMSYWEPFHGTIKKDFGFQVSVKVAEAQ